MDSDLTVIIQTENW